MKDYTFPVDLKSLLFPLWWRTAVTVHGYFKFNKLLYNGFQGRQVFKVGEKATKTATEMFNSNIIHFSPVHLYVQYVTNNSNFAKMWQKYTASVSWYCIPRSSGELYLAFGENVTDWNILSIQMDSRKSDYAAVFWEVSIDVLWIQHFSTTKLDKHEYPCKKWLILEILLVVYTLLFSQFFYEVWCTINSSFMI